MHMCARMDRHCKQTIIMIFKILVKIFKILVMIFKILVKMCKILIMITINVNLFKRMVEFSSDLSEFKRKEATKRHCHLFLTYRYQLYDQIAVIF